MVTKTGTGLLRLVDLRIVDGDAIHGGGVWDDSPGALALVRSVVSGNLATSSGGGISSDGDLTLVDSVVRGNRVRQEAASATARGGGIASTGFVRLSRTSVVENVVAAIGTTTAASARGGGIEAMVGLRAVDSHIDRNTLHARTSSPQVEGGGIATAPTGAVVTLVRSTVNENAASAAGSSGSSFAYGGGVYAARLIASRTAFVGNRLSSGAPGPQASAGGGGAFVTGASAALDRVRIAGSRVVAQADGTAYAEGGGVYGNATELVLRDSDVLGNHVTGLADAGNAETAGAGLRSSGPITVVRGTIDRNRLLAVSTIWHAYARGGGIWANTGALSVMRSTISRNALEARSFGDRVAMAVGGAVNLASANADIVNSTLASNSGRAIADPAVGDAGSSGLAINAAFSTVEVLHTTIARNTAVVRGAAVSTVGGGVAASTFASVYLRGTVLAGNRIGSVASDCDHVDSRGDNLIGSTSGCTVTTPRTSDKSNVPAGLGALARRGGSTETINLRPGSRALNAIPKARCGQTTDQRGVRRPQQRRCEIGAYEHRP